MTEVASPQARETAPSRNAKVRCFREILLWPLQLMPLRADVQIHRHWEFIARSGPDNPWREVRDELTGDPRAFQERHYSEFVNFLPHVQRVLYGEGRGAHGRGFESPVRVFRRSDVRGVRIALDRDSLPIDLQIAHVDLYFFFDTDVVIPVVEIFGGDLDLATVQNLLFRFGRAYPPYWEADGRGGHCSWRVEWTGANGEVLAQSDFERRDKYLAFVREHRSPAIAAHWEWLLRPMVLHDSGEAGVVRYRQLEYHRMPAMAYLAGANFDIKPEGNRRVNLSDPQFDPMGNIFKVPMEEIRARLKSHGIEPSENLLDEIGLRQLFFYDPNGVPIELNFRS